MALLVFQLYPRARYNEDAARATTAEPHSRSRVRYAARSLCFPSYSVSLEKYQSSPARSRYLRNFVIFPNIRVFILHALLRASIDARRSEISAAVIRFLRQGSRT